MTKIREPLSIEKILKDLIGKLKENEIKEFTGKSISHFRKCSDPDDKDHNLHYIDGIKLDILMQRKSLGTPFIDIFLYSLKMSLVKLMFMRMLLTL